MTPTIASRTPEGWPNLCPLCGAIVQMEPSTPSGDAPCPACGGLLWFHSSSSGLFLFDAAEAERIRRTLMDWLASRSQVSPDLAALHASLDAHLDLGSLDTVELVMELEEFFDVSVAGDEGKPIQSLADAIAFILRHRRRSRE